MKLAAVCVTYKRPTQLARLIACFLAQDYPDRELVILDDAGQYDNQQGDRWRLVSVPERFASLGEKRNAAVEMVSEDTDAIAVWDDDDTYLPWALSACAAALERAPWVRPSQILLAKLGFLHRHQTYAPPGNRKLFHAAWAIDLPTLLNVGGYHQIGSGEDQNLMGRMTLAKIPDCDPLELGFDPYCVVWWDREQTEGESPKLSWLDRDGWRLVGDLPMGKITGPIEPIAPDHFDYANPIILPEVHPRPF
jgi:glycosyltransferase involved in cell wall biosynthesis